MLFIILCFKTNIDHLQLIILVLYYLIPTMSVLPVMIPILDSPARFFVE